jgi:hypothetical protein
MANDQRRIEAELNDALRDAAQQGGQRGALDPKRAEALVEAKQQMANELTELQSDMRSAAQKHRKDTPESAQRLGEVITELDATNVMYRVNRSAAEIFYNRAREAAPREGLITEAIETLEEGLRETAALAAAEDKNSAGGVRPDELLAEIGELRRQVQEAQRRQAGGPGQNAGQNPGGQEGSGEQGGNQPGQQGGESGSEGGQSGAQTAGNGNTNGGVGGGLRAWNPNGPIGPLRGTLSGGSLTRETQALGDRVRGFADRLSQRELSQAEIDGLRRMANQLRRLGGDPTASQSEQVMKLIDQIELATLAAAAKSKNEASPHTSIPSADSPQYREAVAEYYRRLGGGS